MIRYGETTWKRRAHEGRYGSTLLLSSVVTRRGIGGRGAIDLVEERGPKKPSE